jgi:hypothetical protein
MRTFQEIARDPRYWYGTAVGLRSSAKVLEREIMAQLEKLTQDPLKSGSVVSTSAVPGLQMTRSFFLLAAFSMENLLKGILVVRAPQLVYEKKIDRTLCTHNVLLLSQRAGFSLDRLDSFFLYLASEQASWAGKYHTPKTSDTQSVTVFGPGYFDAYDRLYGLFCSELERHLDGRVVYKVFGDLEKGPK